MAPDSSDVDAALVAKLQEDATLAALTPDGWYVDEAPANKTQFGIVSLVDAHDTAIFEGRASEDAVYLVKHVELSTVSVKRSKAAAARIDALLDPQPPAPRATLTITGYTLQLMRRVARVRMTEVDEQDPSIRWQHRGGRYQVIAAPIGT